MNKIPVLAHQISVVATFFQTSKYDYALAGALALHAYGYSRMTLDINFITRSEYQSELIAKLQSEGYATEHCSEGYSHHIHPMSSSRIDFIYVDGETADVIFHASTKKIEISGFFIPVVSIQHLIAMKIFAIKNDPSRKLKELSDIKELSRINPIDMEAVHHYFIDYGLSELFTLLTDEINQ